MMKAVLGRKGCLISVEKWTCGWSGLSAMEE
jgi:hypothetical protein